MAATTFAWMAILLCAADGEVLRLKGLEKPATVLFDAHDVPHVYAESWTDAARILGYLHARERFLQMEFFRRQASGTLAEVAGPDAVESDALMRRLGIRQSCELFWSDASLPAEFKSELVAYADGVNQRLEEMKDNLPPLARALNVTIRPWTPIDTLAFSKYMGWDQSGTMDDLWFGAVAEAFGKDAFEELWPVERPYDHSSVTVQARRDGISLKARDAGCPATASTAGPPLVPGAGEACLAAFDKLARPGVFGSAGSFGSNNWAIAGPKTAAGKPILCSDPHLDFKLPSIWYAAHLCVQGKSVAGVTFPGGPAVIIGFNDHLAWGVTNMQADACDFFVEEVHPEDPLLYRHKGKWVRMTRAKDAIGVRGKPAVTIDIDSTVHGPVVHREGKVISLAWTGLGATRDPLAFWGAGRAGNLREFLAALDHLAVPALNICYADSSGNIAMYCVGALPKRKPGQGRLPLDGASGEWDWEEMISRDRLPLAINPPEGYVASANNRPAPKTDPLYLGWMWDPGYRKRRIDALLQTATGMTVETMRPLQLDAHDFAAERFLPVLLAALKAHPPREPVGQKAQSELAKWNYVADAEATGPLLWLRWFLAYRDAVWQDEFASRKVPPKGGSWGFTGTNRREPEIEVLEFLTHEKPDSIWFDDRTTPQRETRDEILIRSFDAAIAGIKAQFGDDVEKWKWKHHNRLKVDSLFGVRMMDRSAGPVPGTPYTLNPGSNGGTVGGGASWRMIIDLADPPASIGVYPGGQSESPASRHYADLMKLWAAGEYHALHAHSSPTKLAAQQGVRSLPVLPTEH